MESPSRDTRKTITDIKSQKRKNNRFSVFLNGEYSLGISLTVLKNTGICVGQTLSEEEIALLNNAESIYLCFTKALRFLQYRPRSEYELRKRLQSKQFDTEVIDQVILKLIEQRLLDDTAFASFWKDNRVAYRPRSKTLIKNELRGKGVATEIAEATIIDLDDEKSAYNAAVKKLKTFSTFDYQSFKIKLGGFLQRRGFNYQTINSTINRLWSEKLD